MRTIPVRYFGQTVNLPDLPEYRKFYRKLEADAWEPHTFSTLTDNLDKDTIYIDVGGWIGVTPFWASRLAKRVVVVEPDPRCREILRELAPDYPNVVLLEGALSSEPSLVVNAVDGFGSSETTALGLGTDSLEVRGVSVAEIMRAAGNEQIFVKIDIEGYEYLISEEIGCFSEYRLRGLQCAVHPALYERTLRGGAIAKRVRTLVATAALARMGRDLRATPPKAKYASMLSYLFFGVLMRAIPHGADLMFLPRSGR